MALEERVTTTFAELIGKGALEIGDGYRAKNSELGGDGHLFLRAGHVTDSHIDFDGVERFLANLEPRVRSKLSRPGDTIVTTKGNSTGRTSFVKDWMPPFVYSPHLSYWRSRDEDVIEPGFLRYWSRAPEFTTQLAGMMASTDMAPYLSLVDQKRLRISLPPISEQRRIANILGTLDDKIELNRRMSETLEAMARALFKSWFVDFDPVRAKLEGRWRRGDSPPGLPAHLYDLFPDRLVESELGEIPEGWETKTFADFVDLLRDPVNPFDAPETLFRHFSIPAFDEGRCPNEELGQTIKSQKTRVVPGVVLLSKLNPEISRVWLVDVEAGDRAVCSTEFLVLEPIPPGQQSFVYCLCRSRAFREGIESLVTGTSKSHQRARPQSILALHVVSPPGSTIGEFERAAQPLVSRAQNGLREARNLAALRGLLLPALVSGTMSIDHRDTKEDWT